MLIQVLVAAKTAEERDRIVGLVSGPQVAVTGAIATQDLLRRLTGHDFNLVVTERTLLPERPKHLLASIRSLPEHPEIVVLSRLENAEDRTSLLAMGCLGVLNPAVDDDSLRSALQALVTRLLESAIYRLRANRPEEQYSLNDFVSESPSMQIFLELARKVVGVDTSLLILGETGVGKERLARAIHAEGPRSRGPFMAINCGALPESLLESELFGHEEGAFTGASRSRKGYFELAHRGTLFLDEVGEMPHHLQVKLLRVLDEHRFQRVGGEKSISVDVRVMAATNRELEAAVDAKQFRSDLFFRLAVVTLEIPPLRERREDIPQLVTSNLEHFSAQTGRPLLRVHKDAMEALVSYEWPGNVREVMNTMERAVLLAGPEEVRVEDLPRCVIRSTLGAGNRSPSSRGRQFDSGSRRWLGKPFRQARKEFVAAFESDYLRSLLESSGGRIGKAASMAGVNVRSLYDMLKRHGLSKDDFKPQ